MSFKPFNLLILTLLSQILSTLLYPKTEQRPLEDILQLPGNITDSLFTNEFKVGLSIIKYFYNQCFDKNLKIEKTIVLFKKSIIHSTSIFQILIHFGIRGYCTKSKIYYLYDYKRPNPYFSHVECLSNFRLNIVKKKMFFGDFHSVAKRTKGLIIMRSSIFNLFSNTRSLTTVILIKLGLLVYSEILKIYVVWFVDGKGKVESFLLKFFAGDEEEGNRKELYGFDREWYLVE